jgi:hypothetical protein
MSASVVAHGIHYAVLAAGVVGIAALLTPRFLPQPTRPRDQHEVRVAALRHALAAHDPTRVSRPTAVLSTAQRVLLPLAVLGSAAAAGAHAAAGPAHFREATLFGLFFAGSALAQLAWAGAVARGGTRGLLRAGVVGNLAVLALWATTRTVGLPFGLMPRPEAVGPWDLACAAWELTALVACLLLLRSYAGPPARVPPWRDWALGPQLLSLGSLVGLVALSLSGASS